MESATELQSLSEGWRRDAPDQPGWLARSLNTHARARITSQNRKKVCQKLEGPRKTSARARKSALNVLRMWKGLGPGASVGLVSRAEQAQHQYPSPVAAKSALQSGTPSPHTQQCTHLISRKSRIFSPDLAKVRLPRSRDLVSMTQDLSKRQASTAQAGGYFSGPPKRDSLIPLKSLFFNKLRGIDSRFPPRNYPFKD